MSIKQQNKINLRIEMYIVYFVVLFVLCFSVKTYAASPSLNLQYKEINSKTFVAELVSPENISEIDKITLIMKKDARGNVVTNEKNITSKCNISKVSKKQYNISYSLKEQGEYTVKVSFITKSGIVYMDIKTNVKYFENRQLFYSEAITINNVSYADFYKLPDAVNVKGDTIYYNNSSISVDIVTKGGNSPIQEVNLLWDGKNIADKVLEKELVKDIYEMDYPVIGHFKISQEGKGELVVNAKNELGSYESKSIGKIVVIDRTKPSITINEKYAKSKRTVYTNQKISVPITIVEENFDEENTIIKLDGKQVNVSWSGNDAEHTAKVTIDKEGEHTMSVVSTDMAKNEAKAVTSATIIYDKTPPAVEITGVVNGMSYGGKDTSYPLSVTITDKYLKNEKTSVALMRIDEKTGKEIEKVDGLEKQSDTGEIQYSITDISEDGYYKLQVMVMDMSGNITTSKSLNKKGKFTIKNKVVVGYFYINRNGSKFQLDANTQEMYNKSFLTRDNISDLVVYEYNINAIKEQNVQILSTTGEKTAEFQFMDVTDAFAEELKKEENKNYNHVYKYTISKNNFLENGSYSIKISSSTKLANLDGNTTLKIESSDEELMNRKFVVDNDKPQLIALRYSNQELLVQLRDDNLNEETVVLKVNDKEYHMKKAEFDSTSTNVIYVYKCQEADEIHKTDTITVTCSDFSGNTLSTLDDDTNTLDFGPQEDNSMLYMLLGLGLVAVLLVVTTVVILILVKKKRY